MGYASPSFEWFSSSSVQLAVWLALFSLDLFASVLRSHSKFQYLNTSKSLQQMHVTPLKQVYAFCRGPFVLYWADIIFLPLGRV